jgi:hypothetical protein
MVGGEPAFLFWTRRRRRRGGGEERERRKGDLQRFEIAMDRRDLDDVEIPLSLLSL